MSSDSLEIAVVLLSDTGLAVRIAVLAAHGERRTYSLLARRGHGHLALSDIE